LGHERRVFLDRKIKIVQSKILFVAKVMAVIAHRPFNPEYETSIFLLAEIG
jgi:hypothetical protein